MSRSKWKTISVSVNSKKPRVLTPKDVSTFFKFHNGKSADKFKVLQPMVGHCSSEFHFKKKYSYYHKKFFVRDE